MRRGWPASVVFLALLAATPSSALASDAGVRAAIKQFQPGLASDGQALAQAVRAPASPAAYAQLDAVTRKFLADLTHDRGALAAQRPSTARVARGRKLLSLALVQLSQSITRLNHALQAAKKGNRRAARRNLKQAVTEARRSVAAESKAARLL